jgi:hypothetical protein
MDIKLKVPKYVKHAPYETFVKYVWRAGVLFTKYVGLAFVKEASQHIHIDTGMSMASLIPFGEELQVRNLKIVSDIMDKSNTGLKKKWYDPFKLRGQSFGRRIRKSPELGKRLGRDAYVIDFGSPVKPFFYLKYEIVVTQFHIHDGTWQALRAGRRAARAYEKAVLRSHLRPAIQKGFTHYMKTGRLLFPPSFPSP